jgi:hypothetical protein
MRLVSTFHDPILRSLIHLPFRPSLICRAIPSLDFVTEVVQGGVVNPTPNLQPGGPGDLILETLLLGSCLHLG